MAEHGGGHGAETHGAHHGGFEQGEFFDLMFPISLANVYTKNGLKDLYEGLVGDMAFKSGLGAFQSAPDALGALFGAEGGGGGGHGGGGGGHH